jgi:integrase/recombinase XerD
MKSKLQKKFIEDMQLRGYADRTQSSYLRAVRQLTNYWHLPAEEISEQQVRDYFLYCKNDAGWSASTMRIAYSGIKFFYTLTLPMDWETIRLLKIKRLSTPPTVLSIDEVRLILKTARQPQIRVFLSTVYSCGLRLSEALNLEVADIDKERMTIRVRDGKGAPWSKAE